MKKIFIICSALFLFFISYIIIGILSHGGFEVSNENSLNNTTVESVPAESVTAEKFINVPAICQYPTLPTGCESVSATMVLQYYNVNLSAEEFANNWLECSDNFYTRNNQLYGPDPNKVFAGNPFSQNSYGCFAGPIAEAINRNSVKLTAKIILNQTLDELCENYIKNDIPILIWATMGMKESYDGNKWTLDDGRTFTWIAGEHCLVLVGYNDDYYFLNDPMSGSTVAYKKSIVQRRFSELGSQAVIICENN